MREARRQGVVSFTDFQLMRAHQLDCRTDRRLEEIVEFAVQAGFEATELDVRGHIKTPDNVASAVAMARGRGHGAPAIASF